MQLSLINEQAANRKDFDPPISFIFWTLIDEDYCLVHFTKIEDSYWIVEYLEDTRNEEYLSLNLKKKLLEKSFENIVANKSNCDIFKVHKDLNLRKACILKHYLEGIYFYFLFYFFIFLFFYFIFFIFYFFLFFLFFYFLFFFIFLFFIFFYFFSPINNSKVK